VAKKTYKFSDSAFNDPLEFIPTFLREPDGSPSQPHQGQQDLIRLWQTGVQDLVVTAGRQWGKSKLWGWFISWYVTHYSNRHVYIVAPSLDQARIIYDEVARNFQQFPLNTLLKGKAVDFPFPHIGLVNGSHVHGRGSNSPKYLRGKIVHLLVEDEAAYFKDGIHPNTIEPMFTVTGSQEGTGIIRISTPFGQGDFYDGAMAAQKDLSGKSAYRHFTSLDNPYADKNRLYAIRDRYGEDSLIWRTEYMGEFVDSDLAVFNARDIKAAYEAYPYQTEEGRLQYPVAPLKTHRYVQGVDLANMRDYFVTTVLDVHNPLMAVQVKHDRLQQKGYKVYKEVIRNNHRAYNSAHTLVDATSLGESVVEDLRDINVEGYKFTGTQAKYDIVHNLVRMFNEHRIAIPFNRELVDELRNFQYEITAAKKLRMEARGSGHDDYVMSLAMSGQLASQPLFTGFFMGVDIDDLGHYKGKEPVTDPFAHDED
jgi:Terminase large subunit, T4likevirus-type, N-terminal